MMKVSCIENIGLAPKSAAKVERFFTIFWQNHMYLLILMVVVCANFELKNNIFIPIWQGYFCFWSLSAPKKLCKRGKKEQEQALFDIQRACPKFKWKTKNSYIAFQIIFQLSAHELCNHESLCIQILSIRGSDIALWFPKWTGEYLSYFSRYAFLQDHWPPCTGYTCTV